jgi:chromosome segregation ATPase
LAHIDEALATRARRLRITSDEIAKLEAQRDEINADLRERRRALRNAMSALADISSRRDAGEQMLLEEDAMRELPFAG